MGISIGLTTARLIVGVKHFLTQVMYQFIGSSLTVIPILLFDFSSYHFSLLSFKNVMIFILVSILDLVGHILVSVAIKLDRPERVTPMIYSNVLFCFIWDILIFNYQFSFMEIFGGCVLFLGVVGLVISRAYH